MRRKVAAVGLAVLFCIGSVNLSLAQSPDPISGEWQITRVILGNTQFHRITLTLEDGKVTGAFASGKKLEGTLQGNVVHFIARDAFSTIECSGTISGDTLSGKFIETFPKDPKNPQESTITAKRVP